jgi:hypothetical protein
LLAYIGTDAFHNYVQSIEFFDCVTKRWHTRDNFGPSIERELHSCVDVGNGRILVLGGVRKSVEVVQRRDRATPMAVTSEITSQVACSPLLLDIGLRETGIGDLLLFYFVYL